MHPRAWKNDVPTILQISYSYRRHKKDWAYGEFFAMTKLLQRHMKKRYMIPKEIVKKYEDTICFMVETDCVFFEAVEPRTKWCYPMGYEVSVEVITMQVEHVLAVKKDPTQERRGTYREKYEKVREE